MQRFLIKKTSAKRTQSLLAEHIQRAFASSPQKNPFDSVLSSLSVGSQQFKLYKMPAL